MNCDRFSKLFDDMISEEKAIASTKGTEYIQGDDRLDNFKRIARELGLSPMKVLWVYLKKHLDSIARYIKTEQVLSEPIEGRITDARMYLALLRGLIEERKLVDVSGSTTMQPSKCFVARVKKQIEMKEKIKDVLLTDLTNLEDELQRPGEYSLNQATEEIIKIFNEYK